MPVATALPLKVVEEDHQLAKAADKLMKLRWRWTLDDSNPKRVGFRVYAREVGVGESRIRSDAKAWSKYQVVSSLPRDRVKPGTPTSPADFRALEQLGEERQVAAKAVAKATGRSVSSVARDKKGEVKAVLSKARERASKKGTTVEHEVTEVAESRVKTDQRNAEAEKAHKAAHTAAFIDYEGDAGALMQRMKKMFKALEGVEFDDTELELIAETNGRVDAMWNLLKLRSTKEVPTIDWDLEFQKITSE